ncbi:MAG: T9SS type A sorting domain-containing protein [Pedobacter sp.]|nr:MAG: T9SS type A sorting domain-containing protein [Pedobacter sp.]
MPPTQLTFVIKYCVTPNRNFKIYPTPLLIHKHATTQLMKKLLLIIFCLFGNAAMAQTPDANGILYVDISKTGGNGSGSSWQNAIPQLADALRWAHQNKSNFTSAKPLQIWVAKGTYKPLYTPQYGLNFSASPSDIRDKAFLMVNHVKLYGGFAGTETAIGERVLPANGIGTGTILSGDFNNNDVITGTGSTLSITNNTENAYHVVVAASNMEAVSTELDGFEIKGGNANGGSGVSSINVNGVEVSRSRGGGIFSNSPFSTVSLTNLSLSGNNASSSSFAAYGGGIYSFSSASYSSTVSLTNSSLSANTASSTAIDAHGGGIYSFSSLSSTVSLINSIVNGNNASSASSGAYGGGIFSNSNYSTVSLTNSSVNGNTASSSDNVAYGGGISSFSRSPSASSMVNLTNSSLSGNTAAATTSNAIGGGIYSSSSNDVNLINSTVAGNKGDSFIYFNSGTNNFKAHNSLVYGNQTSATNTASSTMLGSPTKDIKNSLVQGENSTANGNLDGTSASYTTTNLFTNFATGDYSLKSSSPIIDKGDNNLYTGNLTTDKDLAGNLRLAGQSIDMGAYEYEQHTVLSTIATIVNATSGTANGSITLTVSGGQAPYTFLWADGGITTKDRINLAAGTYVVTITDANGSSLKRTEIVSLTKLTINLTAKEATNCGFNDGKLTVQAQGGTAPYTYQLNSNIGTNTTGEFSNLWAGVYFITATDIHGNTASQFFGINNIEMNGTQVSKTDVSCNGANDGKIEVANISGTSPITYKLDNSGTIQNNGSFSGLSAGSHIITIFDAGSCIYTFSFTISEPAKLQVGVGVAATSTVGASNGSITINPTGGTSPYSYNWGNGIVTQNRTGLATGAYTVTVTDAKGCSKTESITVGTAITTLPVSFGKFAATPQGNRVKLDWNTFSETNNEGFIIYRSTDGLNYTEIITQASKGSTANSYIAYDNNPISGVNYYRLSQKDNDGTITKLADAVVNFSLVNAEVKAWPNPVNKTLNLSFTAGKYQSLRLVDLTGKTLLAHSIAITQSETEIEMSTYPKGTYIVELKGSNGSHLVKVIK